MTAKNITEMTREELINFLTVENVTQVYSGKAGCMCGCLGKHTYTEIARGKDLPGYNVDEDINNRAAKIQITKMINHIKSGDDVKVEVYDSGEGCVYFDDDGRYRAIYTKNF